MTHLADRTLQEDSMGNDNEKKERKEGKEDQHLERVKVYLNIATEKASKVKLAQDPSQDLFIKG